MAQNRIVALATALVTGAVGAVGPAQTAQAAASTWSVTNEAAQANGAVAFRSGGYYDFTGTITIAQDDGQCYYMRFFHFGQLSEPGSGVDSPRLCNTGSLPFKTTFYSYTHIFSYGLCKAAPGTPEEPRYVGLGDNCVQA